MELIEVAGRTGTVALPISLVDSSPTLKLMRTDVGSIRIPDSYEINSLRSALEGTFSWVFAQDDWLAASDAMGGLMHYLDVAIVGHKNVERYREDAERQFQVFFHALVVMRRLEPLGLSGGASGTCLRELRDLVMHVESTIHVCKGRAHDIWNDQSVGPFDTGRKTITPRVLVDTSMWASNRELSFHSNVHPGFYARLRVSEVALERFAAGHDVEIGGALACFLGACKSSYHKTTARLTPDCNGVRIRMDSEKTPEFWLEVTVPL